jgi:hypothetical protein
VGSWRPAAIAAALAAIAWIAVGLGVGERSASSGARRLAPEIAAADVVAIELVTPEASIRASRTNGGFVTGDGEARGDAEVIDLLLGAVEHTWVRRLRAGGGADSSLGLAEPRATLTLRTGGGPERVLRLGAEIDGRDLVWVGAGDDAALITAAEAAQLFPEPRSLADRRPFRAGEITGLEITAGDRSLTAGGEPMKLDVAGGEARVDAAELDALAEALRGLEIAAGEAGPEKLPPLSVRLSSDAGVERLDSDRMCGAGRAAVRSHVGAGCVDAAPLERLRALVADPLALVDDALIDARARFASVVLRRGGAEIAIDPRGPGRDAALEWLGALTAIDAGPARPLTATGDADASLEIRYAGDRIDRLELRDTAGGWIARRAGEPVELPVDGIAPLLEARPVWFRPRALIERDPTELRSARRGGAALDRSAIAPIVAHLSARRFTAAAAAPEHGLARPRAVIELVFDEPPVDTGEPDAYRLEIGAAIDGGCYARLTPSDGAVFVLDAAVCGELLRAVSHD